MNALTVEALRDLSNTDMMGYPAPQLVPAYNELSGRKIAKWSKAKQLLVNEICKFLNPDIETEVEGLSTRMKKDLDQSKEANNQPTKKEELDKALEKSLKINAAEKKADKKIKAKKVNKVDQLLGILVEADGEYTKVPALLAALDTTAGSLASYKSYLTKGIKGHPHIQVTAERVEGESVWWLDEDQIELAKVHLNPEA